jgi:hypothetical protein
MGKIIQIAACGHEHTLRTGAPMTLFALCDDGSLWEFKGTDGSWRKVPLPKTIEPQVADEDESKPQMPD